MTAFSRRFLLAGSACVALGACTPAGQHAAELIASGVDPAFAGMYGEQQDGPHTVPALDFSEIDQRLLRREVRYPTSEAKGTVVVDVTARFLYLVTGPDRAIRYGVGVGKQGYEFRGEGVVGRKATWPGWTPTPNMIADNPQKNKPWAGGMPGGVNNPLGARALYLYRDGADTMYRIHGTNEPWSIGQSVSSGCIRMLNHDVIDLFNRVPQGARVVVRNSSRERVARMQAGAED